MLLIAKAIMTTNGAPVHIASLRSMAQSLSELLRLGIRFLRPPLSAVPSAALRLAFPYGRTSDLPRLRVFL